MIDDNAISEEQLTLLTTIIGHTAETSAADGDLDGNTLCFSFDAFWRMTVANLVATCWSDGQVGQLLLAAGNRLTAFEAASDHTFRTDN